MCGQGIPQRSVIHQEPLEGIVRRQLTCRHDGRAAAVGQPASEPAHGAFLARHANHAVDGMLVVAPVVGGQRGIMLHAHVEDVGKVAGNAAQEARGDGHGGKNGEGGLAAGPRVAGLEFFVDTESDGRVGQLAEEGGGYAAVEGERAVCLDDVDECPAHGFRRIAFAHLQSDLYELGKTFVRIAQCTFGMFVCPPPLSSSFSSKSAITLRMLPGEEILLP